MSKLQLGFGGGIDDILLSLKQKRFFSYEKNRDEIHELFGGKDYYTSRSGDSGSGWINNQNDLIRFGYYRTDARDQQGREVVHTLPNNGEIFGYMPIMSHGGIDQNSPVVLTDGKIVIFCQPDPQEVINWLLEWGKWDGKFFDDYNTAKLWEIEENTYDVNGNHKPLKWFLFNFHNYKGVRATRFVDLRNVRHKIPENIPSNLLLQKLGIFQGDGNFWLHVNQDNVFDEKYENDPRTIKGEVRGWESLGNGIFSKRKAMKIECFIELNRQQFSNGKWWIQDETPEWIDYEKNFSVIEFFSKTEEEITETMMNAISKKAKEDYLYARRRSGVDLLNLMKKNPELFICIQDSLDVGNCLPGTNGFINRFEIQVNETGCVKIETLLNNKEINKMVKDFNFQKVIYRKLNIDEQTLSADEEMKEKLD